MSLADELLADLVDDGAEANEEEIEDDIMDAAEQLEDLAKLADKTVRAVAKLRGSDQVCMCVFIYRKWVESTSCRVQLECVPWSFFGPQSFLIMTMIQNDKTVQSSQL